MRKLLLATLLCLPFGASGDTLNVEEIDRFLLTGPQLVKSMQALQKRLSSDDERVKKIMAATRDNRDFYRTVIEQVGDTQEIKELKSVAVNAGYENIDDWAYTGDRLVSVYFAVDAVASLGHIFYDDEGYTEDTDIFVYVDDQTKPEEIRDTLRGKIEDRCARDCVVPADLYIAGERFGRVSELFEKL